MTGTDRSGATRPAVSARHVVPDRTPLPAGNRCPRRRPEASNVYQCNVSGFCTPLPFESVGTTIHSDYAQNERQKIPCRHLDDFPIQKVIDAQRVETAQARCPRNLQTATVAQCESCSDRPNLFSVNMSLPIRIGRSRPEKFVTMGRAPQIAHVRIDTVEIVQQRQTVVLIEQARLFGLADLVADLGGKTFHRASGHLPEIRIA